MHAAYSTSCGCFSCYAVGIHFVFSGFSCIKMPELDKLALAWVQISYAKALHMMPDN